MKEGDVILLDDILDFDPLHAHKDILCGQLYVVRFIGGGAEADANSITVLDALFHDVTSFSIIKYLYFYSRAIVATTVEMGSS